MNETTNEKNNIWNGSGLFGPGSASKVQEQQVDNEHTKPTFAELVRRNSTDLGSPGRHAAPHAQQVRNKYMSGSMASPSHHSNESQHGSQLHQPSQPYCLPVQQAPLPTRMYEQSNNDIFASIGGFGAPMYPSGNTSLNNNEAGKTFAAPSNAFGLDELVNPRPAHLLPLEAHNISSLDRLSFGLNAMDGSNMYYKNAGGFGGHHAQGTRYAAQPLHNTHQETWHGVQGVRNAHDQSSESVVGVGGMSGAMDGLYGKSSMDGSQAESSFGGSVLQYQDPRHPGRGTSTGTSSNGEKRSSSESNRGSDEGSGGVIVRQYGAGYGNGQSRGRQQNQTGHGRQSHGSHAHHVHHGSASDASNTTVNNKGYRRYWNQVTSGNKGARNSNSRKYSGGGDTSVEGLLEMIVQLPPEMSTVPAVASGLHSLDAGALAALLKELNKHRCSHRAQEIFDWLRKLDSDHPLSALCTTMTFTTMISQCGAQHALRRAMELMAEMKQRKIQCNVHTYSALMNVCIKAGELDLALEVYNEMLNEGCTPNLVTYNTLIDVYGKTGRWEEAIGVLDAVEKKGLEPEARTYNTAIIACNQSSRAQEALQIYERMLKANARPTATTYTALISAYGKAGQLDQALEIFESMERHNCEKNVITYSSLISACEKAGQWQLALKLFNDMHKDGCQPNVVTYNSLIAACAQGAQAETAQQIFDLMQSRGVRADSVTFGALLSAYDRAGDWRNALSSFDVIRSLGCRPDTVVYNTIIGCLWRTGITKCQDMAMQIFHSACKQGHFRTSVVSDILQRSTSNMSSPRTAMNASRSSSADNAQVNTDAVLVTTGDSHLPRVEFGMHAFTIGSAVLCMYRWLCEIRSRFASQPSIPPEIIILTLNKGKPSRDHTYPVIKEALVAKLGAWKAPLDLVDIPVGCQIFGKSQDIARWLEIDAVRTQIDLFLSFANSPANASTDQFYRSDAIAESRCREAFSAVQQLESMNAVIHGAPSIQSPVHDQEELFIDMASYAKSSSACPEDVLYDGFDILLRAIEFGDDTILSYSNHLLVRACYFYAAALAMGESKAVEAVGIAFQSEQQQVFEVAQRLKLAFNGKLSSISPSRVLKLYLERIGVCFEGKPPFNHQTAGLSFALLPFSVSSVGMRKYSASILAAAVLVVGRRNAGISPFWPYVLEQMTGYSMEEGTNLSSAIASVSGLPAGGAFDM